MLSILFICSSLEPGEDGVGDYTRRLACALLKYGHKTAIIALNDRRMREEVWQGKQKDNNKETAVLRLSAALPWDERLTKATAFAVTFNADWISLQYVPFGFHIKGLPFKLGKKLQQLGVNRRWHIMFHELSVNKAESFKFRVWSFLQVRIIKSFLKTLKPDLITTNTVLYRKRLNEIGYHAKLLPLFSNISRQPAVNNDELDKFIPQSIAKHRNEFTIGTLFGSFDFKSWDTRSLLDKFSAADGSKKIVIASIGRMPSGNMFWKNLQNEYPHIIFLALGMQESAFISYWLSAYTDFGILTTLPELAGKSGSFMAYKEHGVPVVCRERTPELSKICETDIDEGLTIIFPEKDFLLPAKYPPVPLFDQVAEQFIQQLTVDNG